MSERVDPDTEMANERLGRTLGGYVLERLVGVGGMAAVYEARKDGGDPVALKVLHPEMCRRPEVRSRFAQEAKATSLIDHPGVVRVLGTGEEADGTAYLVMELLDGDPLGAMLRRAGRPLPVSRILDILDQTLDVLAVAHERGIVHRDLKPDNLFVTTDGQIKVVDFGIARLAEDVPGAHKTKTGVTLGTVPFMSPEQALGKRAQVDGRSDLFSLGAMTFRFVARRNIHLADSDAELLVMMATKPAPPLASVWPEAPEGLAAVVDVALAFSKDSRYPDARTMQGDVRALRDDKPPPYATRHKKAREMATRMDIQAVAPRLAGTETPRTPPPEPAKPATPAQTAPTVPMPIRRDSPAPLPTVPMAARPPSVVAAAAAAAPRDDEAPPSSEWPDLEGFESEAPPLSAPPSSRNVIAMPAVPDGASDATSGFHAELTTPLPLPPPKTPDPSRSAPTTPPKSAAFPTTEPPAAASATPGRRSRAPLFLIGLLIVAGSGFLAYQVAMTQNQPPAPPAPIVLPPAPHAAPAH